LKASLYQTLFKLAELGGCEARIRISTSSLAKSLNLSQQTASRHIIELDRLGLLKRYSTPRGVELTLTPRGVEELRRVYLTLKAVFEGRPKMLTLSGVVSTGLGEGAYYVRQPGYRRQFEQLLGFTPYPGTLNIKLYDSEVTKRRELEGYPGKIVRGFSENQRSFGEAKCFPATLNGVECAVVLINRTHHNDTILEVISPVHLRSTLKLTDGTVVNVSVKID
jgi:riboflavin kinase